MSSEMIERVARAIMETRGGCEVTDWREAERNPSVARAVIEARASIEAMYEPEKAYMQFYPPYSLGDEGHGWYPPNHVRAAVWKQMIRIALAVGE